MLSGCLETRAEGAPGADPLPLDPLSDAEQARAIETMLADAEVAKLLGGERHRVIGAALHVDKARVLAGDFTRYADVHVYRYDSNDVVWPVVDLTNGAVASVTIEKFQPRLLGEEIAEAEAALLEHPRVKEHFGSTDGLSILAILHAGSTETGAPTGACDVHRCVEAMFMKGDSDTGTFVLYDLSTMKLVDLWIGAERGDDGVEGVL